MNSVRESTPLGRSDFLGLAIVGGLAALLLFWDLGEKYLWQDEANTAVLAVRMLQYGKPLGYDGVNLIGNDNFAAEDVDSIGERTSSPRVAVEYLIRRGDLKADTAWKYHPWGQFVVAAASFTLLGKTTLAARLPFALAALATVLLVYWLVRAYCGSPLMAFLASALLTTNTYWILHSRQSRYYALSSLLLLITVLAYLRWQDGKRWGATNFVLGAWCWFQVDYGTVWPVFGVVFFHAFAAQMRDQWRNLRRLAVAGVALVVTIAPFAYYYELWDRRSVQLRSWQQRFQGNLFNMNEYVIATVLLITAIALVAWRWNKLRVPERSLVAISSATLVAFALWVPTVAPEPFVRYVVMAVPLGCVLTAWVLVRGVGSWSQPAACLGALVIAATPWLSNPFQPLSSPPAGQRMGAGFRSELAVLGSEVFGHRPDPNRIVVEWLRQNATPTDEILVNYEDLPLMFYLPNPIRGGVAAFRAEDDVATKPRFAILRQTVPFVHWPVFVREVDRYQWKRVSLRAPDVIWGNNPDPMGYRQDPARAENLVIARRIDAPASPRED